MSDGTKSIATPTTSVENNQSVTPPTPPSDEVSDIDFKKIKESLSRYVNSRVFLLRFSVVLSLMTLLAVLLYWAFSPSVTDLDKKVKELMSLQQETKTNITKIQNSSVTNFDAMGGKLNDLGIAQMKGFQDLADAIEKHHETVVNDLDEVKQTVKDEGVKNRNAVNRLHKSLEQLSAVYEDMPAPVVKIRVAKSHNKDEAKQ